MTTGQARAKHSARQRAFRLKQLAAGKCTVCPEKLAPRSKCHCPAHYRKTKARQHALYLGIVARGLCIICKVSKARTGWRTCRRCHANLEAGRPAERSRYRSRQASGVCAYRRCAGGLSKQSKIHCEKHRLRARKKHIERYWRLKSAGVCLGCSLKPAVRQGRCEPCARRIDAMHLRWERKQRERGLCMKCRLPATNGGFCAVHADKVRGYRRSSRANLTQKRGAG